MHDEGPPEEGVVDSSERFLAVVPTSGAPHADGTIEISRLLNLRLGSHAARRPSRSS